MLVIVTLVACGEDEPELNTADWSRYSLEEGTVVCPSGYALAGERFSFVTDDELTWIERTVNDKFEEKRLAEKKVIEKNCGARSQPTRSPREVEADRVRAEQEREQAARDREAGFHCLSGWDGNFNNLEALIRRQLHNPDSMETVRTRIAPAMPNGKHPVEMVFRAENQYGAVVTVTALGSAHSSSCIAELFSIGDQIFADAGYSHEIFGIIPSE